MSRILLCSHYKKGRRAQKGGRRSEFNLEFLARSGDAEVPNLLSG